MKKAKSKYLSMLAPPDDKYDAPEYNLAKANMPAYVTEPIPGCIYDRTIEGEGDDATMTLRYRLDVVQVLYWVMCRRDNPDITLDEVGKGIKAGNVRDLVFEIFYFWSESTREELEAIFATMNTEDEATNEELNTVAEKLKEDAENPTAETDKMVVIPLES